MRAYKYPFLTLLVCLSNNVVNAKFAEPTYAPVERLIANATAFVKENPKNAHGYYTLGRIHYLAFASKVFWVPATDNIFPPNVTADGLVAHREYVIKLTLHDFGYPSISDVPEAEKQKFWNSVNEKEKRHYGQDWQFGRPDDRQLADHAAAAVRNFKKAIELEPQNGLYHLGFASLLEQYVQFLTETEQDKVPKEFRSIILDKAKEIYYTAYSLSIRKNLKRKERPLHGLRSLVGYEAGKAYVRLSEADASISEDQKTKTTKIKKDLQKLDALPRGWITPIIFSIDKQSSLSDLLDPDSQVFFDLDGDGVTELWPWVKPTTGILVWDPDRKCEITSGRQLFGSVSWWLFFADGYQALDVLDDNRDGTLTGQELVGMSVWFDRNCDGRSDSSEVLPLEKTPIVALATKSSGKYLNSPMNAAGLTLKDGRTLPTYDWITSPVKSHRGLLPEPFFLAGH